MRFGMRELIFVVLLIAMPVASYFFIFEPRNVRREEAKQEIRDKQQKLTRLEQATRSINDIGEEIDRLVRAIDLFEQKLPAEQEMDVILKQVWELAAKHRLTPKSVRTDKISAAAQYSELPIKMTITGNFDGFYSFLLEMERISRITRMPQMKLLKLDGEEVDEGQMQADIVLTVFFERREDAIAPGAKGDRL